MRSHSRRRLLAGVALNPLRLLTSSEGDHTVQVSVMLDAGTQTVTVAILGAGQ